MFFEGFRKYNQKKGRIKWYWNQKGEVENYF